MAAPMLLYFSAVQSLNCPPHFRPFTASITAPSATSIDRDTLQPIMITNEEALKTIVAHELVHDLQRDTLRYAQHKSEFQRLLYDYLCKIIPDRPNRLYVWYPVADKQNLYEKWEDMPDQISLFEWCDMMIPGAREEMERDLAARSKNGSASFSEGDDAWSAKEKKFMREYFARRGQPYATPKWALEDDSLGDLERFLLETMIDTYVESLTIGDPSTWVGSLKWFPGNDCLCEHPTRKGEIVARRLNWPALNFELAPDFVQECFEASKDGENPLIEFVTSRRLKL